MATVSVRVNLPQAKRVADRLMERDVVRAVRVVEEGAKRRVGYDETNPGPHLRDAIRSEVRRDTAGPYGRVWADHDIALIHHEGTAAHVIYPRKPGGRLVFYWAKAGRVVFARKVSHPGTSPNRYLADSLRDIRRLYK